MLLGFRIGAGCNAACAHCAQAYGPDRTERLPKEQIFRLMDEAASIDDGVPLCFAITGGEPFLYLETLIDVVAYGTRLGGSVSCVTNAFWAKTPGTAAARLAMLRECGLSTLAVSVSRFHQRFIPLERPRLALETARRLGILTTLKVAVLTSDLEEGGALADWEAHLVADEVQVFPVLPYLRTGEAYPEHEYYRERGLPEMQCPNEIMSIELDGGVHSCCSPGPADDFLALGNVMTESLAKVQRRFLESGKQRILRETGPIAFARAAIAAGLGHCLREDYAGPCDLCLHIRADPVLRRVAEETAAACDAPGISRVESSEF